MVPAKSHPTKKAAMSVREACEYASISKSLIYELFKDGSIKAKKAGRKTLVPVSELDAWLASLPDAAA